MAALLASALAGAACAQNARTDPSTGTTT